MPTKTPLRIKSGIDGFDELVYGGIPRGSLIVVSGDPGSGKTIFCIEFLYNRIKLFGEPGIFISLEEEENEIIEMASFFGFDLADLINKGKLIIETIELYDFEKLKNTMETLIEKIHAKTVVIDPGVVFRLFFEKELDARKSILSLAKMLKRIGCTTIITNEISLTKIESLFGLEEYVADGVILLYHTKLGGKFLRSIAILKMRNTKIKEALYSLKIDNKGLHVLGSRQLTS